MEKEVQGHPDFKILACLIQIWNSSGSANVVDEPESVPIMLGEVGNIEIHDSYKNLFSTAKVSFPRGTVMRTTVTETNIKEKANVVSATLEGDLVVTTRVNTQKIKREDFHMGQRIRIRLGYIDDAKIAELAKTNNPGPNIYNDKSKLDEYRKAMAPPDGSAIMFDGYITKCSIEEPITLECEDMASVLKKKSCPNEKTPTHTTVQDLFGENGKYQLLKGTGLKLYPKNDEIDVGSIDLTDDFTVADLLTTWAKKARLFSFIIPDDSGNPSLAIGRSYFSNIGKDSIETLKDTSTLSVPDIRFDYNVADNGLTLMDVDKKFLAVKAQAWEDIAGARGRQYEIVVRRNPDYDPATDNESDKYQIINETKLSAKAIKAGANKLTKNKDKVNLDTYTIIPYSSSKIGISHSELLEEAKKYLESYNANGAEGTLTIFGDFNLKSGRKVHLTDNRFPTKNGYYFVDEVTTKFGVDGFRQVLKIPYCISRDSKEDDKQ